MYVQATAAEDFLVSYILFIITIGGILVLFIYRGADKSLARPGRKKATSTKDFLVSYVLFIIIIGGILVLFIYRGADSP